MPRPKTVAAPRPVDQWEFYKPEIHRLFIEEKQHVSEIVKYMKQIYGFDKALRQYEYQLRKWRFRRNLRERDRRSIRGQILRREQAGRQSEIAVSWSNLSQSEVTRKLLRHKDSCAPIEHKNMNASLDTPIRVGSPSPMMMSRLGWPEDLPWLQFISSFIRSQHSLKINAGRRSVAKRQGQEALLLKIMGSYIEPAPKVSVRLAADRLNSPQTMRAVLDVIAPQGYPGGHALMADEIHHGSLDSLTVRMLWLLIYLETNDMVYRLDEITGCKIDFSVPGKMLDFLWQTGFLTKANIAWLATSAGHTSQSFLKRLLDHAIFDEKSIDVLGWLVPDYFNISHSVEASDYYCDRFSKQTNRSQYSDPRHRWPLLYASSLAGNTEAVRLLLKLGAEDMYETIGPPGRSPLECAASLKHDDHALVITDLLLSKPTGSSPQCQMNALEGALELAIERSHTKLILRLLSELERRGHGTISSRYATVAVEYADCDTIHILVNQNLRSGSGSISFPGTILFSAIVGPQEVGLDCLTEKLTYLLSCGADPAIPKCEKGCGRGFILDYVILFSQRGDTSEDENAALSLAELMRKHGCPPVRPKPVSGPDYDPSALQLAICLGYPRLTEYLLDWGVDIDHYQEEFDCVCVECDAHDDMSWDDRVYDCVCSSLLTALRCGQTEIAKMLLKRNPSLKLRGGELDLAVELDDTELVTTLLQAGSTDIKEWSKLLTRAISCKSPKSTRMLLSMSNKDYASIDIATILQASLLIGDTNSAYQQAAFCNYNSQILFEAVLHSHTSKDYHKIVERILHGRRPSPNDDFELGAVASAAIHNDAYLMHILTKCMGQGPWAARFPYIGKFHCAEDGNLSRWNPNPKYGLPTHILNYAAELDKYGKDSTVLQTMLKFGVTANGMYLNISDSLTADSLKQLIAAGADPNHGHAIHDAASMNMLAHVKVLCEAKVPLNTVKSTRYRASRAALQSAVESRSPKMLQLLLHYGAQVECPAGFNYGATCLQLAAGAGDIGLVCLLLDKGAKVNAKRALLSGRTAIEIAAERGRLDILKLLLLRGDRLFQTAAERYQFIRAASLAVWEGHEPIVEVLRQHINWNGNDQRLFEQSKKLYDERNKAFLDDMTEKLLDSERQRADQWAREEMEKRNAGEKSAYDNPGIEEWLGESTEEEADGNQTGELRSAYQHAQDDFGDRTNLCGDLAGEHSARQSHAWGSGAEARESLHTPAARAFHYQDSGPAWVEMQDNDVDMMQDLSGGLGDLGRTCESLAFGIETQNVNQEPGMVLGEMVEEEDHSQFTSEHDLASAYLDDWWI